MINVHLGFLQEFSMDRVGLFGMYFFMATCLALHWRAGTQIGIFVSAWPVQCR